MRSTRSISETRRKRSSRLSTGSTEAEEVRSGTEDNSLFDVLVEAAAQRKRSRERARSRGGQTVYDVLVEATVERMGGWRRITPEDVVTTSREKTILDTYKTVSTDLKNTSSLPERLASSLGGASLYDTVINTVADIHLMVGLYFIFMNLLHLPHLLKKAEDVLEAAKKQTIYEVLLNAMAAAKTKHSIELPKDSLYDELKTKTRQMPDDVKVK